MRYIAFLRAINVGGHTVKMDRLRGLFEEMGLRNVETFIASGNVLFDSAAKPPSLESKIERQLEAALGFPVATFLRTADEVRLLGKFEVFPGAAELPKPHLVQVGFLKAQPAAATLAAIDALCDDVNRFRAVGRELHWHSSDRVTILRLTGPVLERKLGAQVTFRSVNTVRRLGGLLAATSG
jgi:uncharacterized protein (DUF1697 family)